MAWYGHLAALLFIAREQSMTNHHLNVLVFSRPKSANKVYTYYTCVCVCIVSAYRVPFLITNKNTISCKQQ